MPDHVDLFRAAIEGSPDAFFLLRCDRDKEGALLDFVLIDMNTRAGGLLGRSRDESLGRGLDESVPGAAEHGLYDALAKVVATREPWEGEYSVERGESPPVWLRMTAVAVGDGVAVTARDTTRRRRAEQGLFESEARLHAILDAVPGVIYQYRRHRDGRNDTRFVSSRCVEVLDVLPEEFMRDASPTWERIHPDDRRRVAESADHSALTGEPWQLDFRMFTSAGRVRWIRGYAVPQPRATDGSILWTGILFDTTANKQLEEQLFQAQKMESVGRLAGGVAHDFNNLLSAILGYAELTADRLEQSHPAHSFIANLYQTAEKGAALTQRLLAFARRQVIEPQIFDLNEVVAGLRRLLPPLIGEHIRLVQHANGDTAPVCADPGLIEQVVLNLAVNARDAMPGGGTLTVATSNVVLGPGDPRLAGEMSPGAYVALIVTDTGTGIPPEVTPHLFEPFFTTKPPGKGTGLGLATSYGIIRQSGGAITIDSTPGAGTRVTILLPRGSGAPASAAEPSEADGPATGHETILLAEDEVLVREIAAEALRGQGYTVIEAADGEQALEIVSASDTPIDILVTDVVMPRRGGPSLARELVSRRPDLRVLYVSGYTFDETLAPGADTRFELLQKPFTPSTLARKVRELLDRPLA